MPLISGVGGDYVLILRYQLVPVARQVDFLGYKTIFPSSGAPQQPNPGSGSAGNHNHEIVQDGLCWRYRRALATLNGGKW